MLKKIITSNLAPWAFVVLVFVVIIGAGFFKVVNIDENSGFKNDGDVFQVLYPNGGELIGKSEFLRVKYMVKLLDVDTWKENIEKQMYLVRPDGVVEGLIGDIDLNKGEIEFDVNKLKYPAGLDVVVKSPPSGKYKIMLVVFESELSVVGTDMPKMVFWSESDRFDGQNIIRNDGSVVSLMYVDVSDDVFEIN